MIEQSESIAALADALSKAQGEFESVAKGESAEIPGKEGKRGYSYKYADLPSIVDAVRPTLAKHGLSVSQFPVLGPGGASLTTQLMHSSGEWMRGTIDLPVGPNVTAQALGSALTYLRRYCFGGVLGIVTDADDDGAKATSDRGGESRAREPQQTTRRSAPSSTSDTPTTEITTPQMNAIRSMCNRLDVKGDEVHGYVSDVLVAKWPEFVDENGEPTLTSLKQLTKSQASYVLDQLKPLVDGEG
jgi:hypothetical protein